MKRVCCRGPLRPATTPPHDSFTHTLVHTRLLLIWRGGPHPPSPLLPSPQATGAYGAPQHTAWAKLKAILPHAGEGGAGFVQALIPPAFWDTAGLSRRTALPPHPRPLSHGGERGDSGA